MIFIIFTEDKDLNEGLLSAAIRLSILAAKPSFLFAQSAKHSISHNQQKNSPLQGINPSESLFVVGHQQVKNNTSLLSKQTADELLVTLQASGLNLLIKNLKLILIACRSGLELANPSFAAQLLECFFQKIRGMKQALCNVEENFPIIAAPDKLISVTHDGFWVMDNAHYQAYRTRLGKPGYKKWALNNIRPATPDDFKFFSRSLARQKEQEDKLSCDDIKVRITTR